MDNELDFEWGLPSGEKVDLSISRWKKEAEQGDFLAKFFLGQCYEKGIGTEIDPEKAKECHEKEAVENARNKEKFRQWMEELNKKYSDSKPF